jgi:hypothetical protein
VASHHLTPAVTRDELQRRELGGEVEGGGGRRKTKRMSLWGGGGGGRRETAETSGSEVRGERDVENRKEVKCVVM